MVYDLKKNKNNTHILGKYYNFIQKEISQMFKCADI